MCFSAYRIDDLDLSFLQGFIFLFGLMADDVQQKTNLQAPLDPLYSI